MKENVNIVQETILLLKNCPLFVGLETKELKVLLDDSTSRIRTFQKGDLVAQAGDVVHFRPSGKSWHNTCWINRGSREKTGYSFLIPNPSCPNCSGWHTHP